MQENEHFFQFIAIILGTLTAILLFFASIFAYFLFFSSFSPFRSKNQKRLSRDCYCKKHPNTHSHGLCAICDEYFCKNCLRDYENLHFCPKHFNLYINNRWTKIDTVKTSALEPENSLYIYDFKKHLWTENKTPLFIITHYRINLENDLIESFISLHAKEDDANDLHSRLKAWKTTR